MGRSFAVVAFIACAFGAGAYFLQRRTIASGEVLGAELIRSNAQHVKDMHCDKDIPVSAHGAHFACDIEYRNGEVGRMVFEMDRAGMIHPATGHAEEKIKRSSDPWDN